MKNSETNKVFHNLPTLKTKRLILRKLKMSDACDIYEYGRDPLVSRYTIWARHKSIKDTRGFLKYVQREYRKAVPESWGMILKENGKLIGTCGFNNYNSNFRKAEIGYAMSRKYWGKGLMTEAVEAMLDFGFGKLKLNRICAHCMIDNKGSEKVMKKCGMKFEGIMREGIFVKGKPRDLKMYAILKKEWLKTVSRI
ncbi:MAG: GNAT family protein [Elusimicrobiota bacterium]